MAKTITMRLELGRCYKEWTFKDGEIGDDCQFTLKEWQELSDDERLLFAVAWAGGSLTETVEGEDMGRHTTSPERFG